MSVVGTNKSVVEDRGAIVPVGAMAAVVVTFHPDADFQRRLSMLCSQFDHVVVVDNASAVAPCVDSNVPCSIQLIVNEVNSGIARALNQGVAAAAAGGAYWVAMFDQDTDVAVDFRECMVGVIESLPHCERNSVVLGANYLDAIRQRPAHPVADTGVTPVLTLISSGMVMPVTLLDRIGGFNETYFIDSVDHEFCLRARLHGVPVLRTRRVLMSHRIGAVGGSVLSRALSLHHPASRKYSIARNAIATAIAYRELVPAWALRQAVRVVAEAVGISLFERDKRAKLAALWRGGRDGLKGRLG